jgi:DNA-binding PadR family transcriptional regulator
MLNGLVSGKAFIMVNKHIAKEVGLVPATIYGELASTHDYWESREQLTEKDGKKWFFCTVDNLEEKTTVKEDAQRKAIKKLEREGYIEVKRFGLPARRYFHITDKFKNMLLDSEKAKDGNNGDSGEENTDKACSNQFLEKPGTGSREKPELEHGKTRTNNKHINNKQNNNKQELSIDNYKETSIYSVDEFKRVFTEVCNSFYNVFATGRWSKKQWNTLINKFVAETIEKGIYKNIPVDKLKGFAFKSIENMAEHADYKKSDDFKEVKDINSSPVTEPTSDNPRFYNWLEE